MQRYHTKNGEKKQRLDKSMTSPELSSINGTRLMNLRKEQTAKEVKGKEDPFEGCHIAYYFVARARQSMGGNHYKVQNLIPWSLILAKVGRMTRDLFTSLMSPMSDHDADDDDEAPTGIFY